MRSENDSLPGIIKLTALILVAGIIIGIGIGYALANSGISKMMHDNERMILENQKAIESLIYNRHLFNSDYIQH